MRVYCPPNDILNVFRIVINMVLATQADFRKIDKLWGLHLTEEIAYIGANYARHLNVPEDVATATVTALAGNTDVYVLGGGKYQRLSVGGRSDGTCDYPLAMCDFNRGDENSG